ncbi:AI-2E family transporter [Halopseudomonas salegens]|uniref:Predicted PurR-regulated permease PerM n=1 Tax=Halopseudomonas salegens TaxID=1434072 RepID=A0A1H2EUR1_9GAMM|nr:AI-2E family transporter [Halopseudomonas salegens]SDT98824.1 Predicted PurR-regulated permease PerM [Halopseudomonas salegens]
MLNGRPEDKSFVVLLIAVSLAFIWLLLPYYSAIFWGTILAILFYPVQRRIADRMPNRPSLAAGISLLLILFIVILPVTLLTASLVRQARSFYEKVKQGDIDFGDYFQQVMDAMPGPLEQLLQRFGLDNLDGLQDYLAQGAEQAGQFIATHALSVGSDTVHFLISFAIMLYLLFFLLRDGKALAGHIRRAAPLSDEHKGMLQDKFTRVVKATVKGNILVAAVQGALGGIIFWILGLPGAVLWGVLMGILSLLPAVGASLIWGPVAIYFLATGDVVKAIVLTSFGAAIIGLADNVLRPMLVGKELKLPDYVVLIATIGGLSMFGLNGFVIGPLIAALFISVWLLFAERREATETAEIGLQLPQQPAISEDNHHEG